MVQSIVNDNEYLIKGILNNDSKIIELIYKENLLKIKIMVSNFKNINIDAEDVFQEGLTRSIFNIKTGKYKNESSFSTYLYAVCKRIVLKEYNKNKSDKFFDNIVIKDNENNIEKEYDEQEYFETLKKINEAINKLNQNCKKIIRLRFGIDSKATKSLTFKEIAKILNIKPDNARQQFVRCLNKLKNNDKIKKLNYLIP